MFLLPLLSGKVKILHPTFSSAPGRGRGLVLMARGLLASQRVEAVITHGLIDRSRPANGLHRDPRRSAPRRRGLPRLALTPRPSAIAASWTVQNLPPPPIQPYVPQGGQWQHQRPRPSTVLYAAEEPSMREDFENKEVELVGQYMRHDQHASGDVSSSVRMYMVCCGGGRPSVA